MWWVKYNNWIKRGLWPTQLSSDRPSIETPHDLSVRTLLATWAKWIEDTWIEDEGDSINSSELRQVRSFNALVKCKLRKQLNVALKKVGFDVRLKNSPLLLDRGKLDKFHLRRDQWSDCCPLREVAQCCASESVANDKQSATWSRNGFFVAARNTKKERKTFATATIYHVTRP